MDPTNEHSSQSKRTGSPSRLAKFRSSEDNNQGVRSFEVARSFLKKNNTSNGCNDMVMNSMIELARKSAVNKDTLRDQLTR